MTGENVADESSTIARVFHQVDGLDPVAAACVLGWGQDTVVVVDEAGMVATPDVVRLLEVATAADARVVLVGDPHQYAAVKARSGMLATLAHEIPDAVELSEVFRQQDPAERAASRGLRDGDGAAVGRAADWYAEHGRLSAGSVTAMLTDALEAWHADVQAGWDSLLVADSNDTVDALNVAAQRRMVADGVIDPSGACVPVGSRSAYVGDVVLTRRNDYGLVSSTGEPVRNGQRWKIAAIGEDGSAQLCRFDDSGSSADAAVTVTVPGKYLGQHTQLGYASTGHGCQGVTVDAARVVTEAGRADRAGVYVPLTRGRKVNALYLAETSPGDSETGHDRSAVTDADDAADSRVRRESVEYARDLLVAACSRERADVTPHALWGKNWDRWSMERMSTDLAVDVHPFAGTPMAEAMERRRQLRDTRWDAYADRVSGQAAEVADMDVTEVVDDAAVPAEAPVGPSPRPEAQRHLHAVPTRVLQQATEFPFMLVSKVHELTTEMAQSDAAAQRVEQLRDELEACRQQVAKCDRKVQVSTQRVQESEQVASAGIGWMKGRKKKMSEQQDINQARRGQDAAIFQQGTAVQALKQRSHELEAATSRAAQVQVSPEHREQLETQIAMYRSLQDVAAVNRELRDRELETQYGETHAIVTAAKAHADEGPKNNDVVVDSDTTSAATTESGLFMYSMDEMLDHAYKNRGRSKGTGSTTQENTTNPAPFSSGPEANGPEL